VDLAWGNLARTFINAFVDAGFGNNKLMVKAEEGNSWIYKNKDHGMPTPTRDITVSNMECKHDECYGKSWTQSVIGYRCGSEPCQQVHLLLQIAHQG